MTARVRRHCGSCGAPFSDAGPTCPACGASQASLAATARGVPPAVSPSTIRWMLLAFLGLFLAILYAFHYIGVSHLVPET